MILQKYKLCHDQPCTSVFLSATATAQNRQSGSGEHLISAASMQLMMIAVNVNYRTDIFFFKLENTISRSAHHRNHEKTDCQRVTTKICILSITATLKLLQHRY